MKSAFLFLVFSFSLIVVKTNGQTFTWIDGEETGYQMNPDMVKYTVSTSPDGTVWFAGLKEKTTHYYSMMGKQFLFQYDDAGNRLNEYFINGILVIYVIETDENGNVFIAGEYINENIVFWDGTEIAWNGSSINAFMAKILGSGVVDWTLNLNETIGSFSPVTDLHFENGTLYVAHTDWPDSFVSTVDETGSLSQIIEQTEVGVVSGLDLDSQGNLYLAASCADEQSLFNGLSFPSPFSYDKLLVKYDPQHVPLWVQYVEDVTCIEAQVCVDQNDFIYWAGPLTFPCTFDTIELQGPEWVFDFFLTRYSPEGQVQWAREVPEVLTGDATTGSLEMLQIMPDNTVSFAGILRGFIDWGNGFTTGYEGNYYDVLVMNYDADGDIQWVKSGGGDSWENTNSMDVDMNGDLFITGVAHDTTRFDDLELYLETFYYPFIVKLEPDTYTGTASFNEHDDLMISPNPVINTLHLSYPAEEIDLLQIFSLQGQLVDQNTNRNECEVSRLLPGYYFVKVRLSDGQVHTGKILKF